MKTILSNGKTEMETLSREDGNDGYALGKTETMETLLGRRKRWIFWGGEEDGDGNTSCRCTEITIARILIKIMIAPQILHE